MHAYVHAIRGITTIATERKGSELPTKMYSRRSWLLASAHTRASLPQLHLIQCPGRESLSLLLFS